MGAGIKQFRALVVDPNPLTRSYIWESVLSDRHFSVVTASKSAEECAAQFQQGFGCDVILISSNIDLEQIRKLVGVMRASEGGKEAALVTIVYAREQNATALASLLAEGSDGLLLSPFSVHSLAQVAEIAKRVQKDFDRKRKLMAAKLMAREVLEKFDEIHRALSKSTEVTKSIGKLAKTMGQMERIVDGASDIVVQAISEVIRDIEPPKSSYKGPSQRVKKKLEASAAS